MSSDTISLTFSAKEATPLYIKGKRYLVAYPLDLVTSHFFEAASSRAPTSFRIAIANMIESHLECESPNRPSVEDIAALSDDALSAYFDAVFVQTPGLGKAYAALADQSDICQRFITAYQNFISTNLSQALTAFGSLSQQNVNLVQNALLLISDSINNFVSTLVKQTNLYSVLSNTICNSISSCVTALHVSGYSLSKRQELERTYADWAHYGWTCPPNAPITLFYTTPENAAEADAIVIEYCSEEDMEELFASTLKCCSQVDDYQESIFDYQHGKYKSCSCLLFALIDGELIRRVPVQPDQQRPSGRRAAKVLFQPAINNFSEDDWLLKLLQYKNVWGCINESFKHGGDFIKEFPVLNRNFIDHGMLRRSVTQKDCIQLFLLYKNLLESLSFFCNVVDNPMT